MKVGMFNSLRGGAARFAESVKKYNGDIEFVDLDCPPTLENVEKLRGCEGFLFQITHQYLATLVPELYQGALLCFWQSG